MKIVFLEPLGITEYDLNRRVVRAIEEADIDQMPEIIYYPDRAEDTETLIERSKDADVVVLSNIPFDKEVMEKCPKLKYLCVAFTGVDHIDVDYCQERGIQISNALGYATVAVADLVFGMVISLARHMREFEDGFRDTGDRQAEYGFELQDKTFGVLGLGSIGRRVAKIANAFGCNVIGWSRSKKDLEYVQYVSFEEVLRRSDIVSLHVALTDDTKNLIGRDQILMMKKDAILINTSRGGVVDDDALAVALNENRIGAAGIDVFNEEPPMDLDKPLLHAKNTLVTPHIAFAGPQAFEKRADIVAKNLAGWLKGQPENLVL